MEEGSATYDWENNAVFRSQTYAEDYNGGSVDLWLYIVGAESDLVTGRDIPNFWEMNAVMVTVETDCLAAETTTTTSRGRLRLHRRRGLRRQRWPAQGLCHSPEWKTQ